MAAVEWPASRTSIWIRIRDAQAGRGTAVNEILVRYREPIRRFLEVKGLSSEDAEDVTQEVMLTLVEGGVLAKADRARGRFRSLLIAVAKNVMARARRDGARQKRGGGIKPVSLSDADIERLVAERERDDHFDREWVAHLLSLAMERLKREHAAWFQALDLYLDGERTYAEVAALLGSTENVVDSHLRQAKARLADFLRAEMAGYASSAAEWEEEQAQLLAYLVNR